MFPNSLLRHRGKFGMVAKLLDLVQIRFILGPRSASRCTSHSRRRRARGCGKRDHWYQHAEPQVPRRQSPAKVSRPKSKERQQSQPATAVSHQPTFTLKPWLSYLPEIAMSDGDGDGAGTGTGKGVCVWGGEDERWASGFGGFGRGGEPQKRSSGDAAEARGVSFPAREEFSECQARTTTRARSHA